MYIFNVDCQLDMIGTFLLSMFLLALTSEKIARIGFVVAQDWKERESLVQKD